MHLENTSNSQNISIFRCRNGFIPITIAVMTCLIRFNFELFCFFKCRNGFILIYKYCRKRIQKLSNCLICFNFKLFFTFQMSQWFYSDLRTRRRWNPQAEQLSRSHYRNFHSRRALLNSGTL